MDFLELKYNIFKIADSSLCFKYSENTLVKFNEARKSIFKLEDHKTALSEARKDIT